MTKGKWIFRYRDFEFCQGVKYLLSREERGKSVPAFYPIPRPALSVRFNKNYDLVEPTSFRVTAEGGACVYIDYVRQNGAEEFSVGAGQHKLMVVVGGTDGMCALRIDGDVIFTDESWIADMYDGQYEPVGTSPLLTSDELPGGFEFPCEEIKPVSDSVAGDERIVDFGRETFVKLEIEPESELKIFYGESLGETMSDRCVIIDYAKPGKQILRARACRFVRFTGGADFPLRAFYVRPDREDISVFESPDERLKKVWDVSKYTLDLCSPMFFLDGIKRDRWPWAGDAYITAKMNYYSFGDQDIVRRTLILLRGEYDNRVVGGILEYTFYWFMMLHDYYLHTGDLDFIRRNYGYAKEILTYYLGMLEDGLLANFGAWLFIDWHDIEKNGFNCCVQMLLGAALRYMTEFAGLLGEKSDEMNFGYKYKAIVEKIELYWDKDQHAYVSTFADGKPSKQVRRHQNCLAVVLGYADEKRTAGIIASVIENDNIPKLTTPFYKFFEYEILCQNGRTREAFERMKAYYGGMIDLGATTIWEEFDPDMKGEEHYAMYGDPYDKSLCHAWGAGTLYFVGRYLAGVKPTSPGYETFEVSPSDVMGDFRAVVPVNGRRVEVTLEGGKLSVFTDREGGVLKWRGKEVALTAGETITIQ